MRMTKAEKKLRIRMCVRVCVPKDRMGLMFEHEVCLERRFFRRRFFLYQQKKVVQTNCIRTYGSW